MPKRAPELLVGYAVGGPRHGIKLSAGHSWDGLIRQSAESNASIVYWPGKYIWSGGLGMSDEFKLAKTWIWQPVLHAERIRKAPRRNEFA
jgi:hypothetical protein